MLFALCVYASVTIHVKGRGLLRTQSGIEHVKCHLVALRCTGNRHQSLVAVVLRLVNLNDASAELSNLVDLSSALADDGTNHVVGDEDLLRQRLARYHALDRLLGRPGVAMRRRMTAMWLRLMRSSSRITRLW